MIKKNSPFNEILIFSICEIAVAGLTILGFIVAELLGFADFNLKVVFGAALGCAVIIANYMLLTMSVNRAINNYMELRGSREMTDEEAEQFAKENSAPIQNAIKNSFIVRTVSMVATLVIAFMLSWFHPLATAIPLFAFRPILTFMEIMRKKYDKAPNPDNFIKYDYENENNEEKEGE